MSIDRYVLQPSLPLFNNIASSGECTGRVSSTLEVFPVPKITWEFESIGADACEPNTVADGLIHPIVGPRFFIERPFISSQSWGTITGLPRVFLAGTTLSCLIGEESLQAHSVRFYLPNCRFLEANLVGQGRFQAAVTAIRDGEPPTERSSRSAGRFLLADVEPPWTISLETTQEALEWLRPRSNNVGTYITTSGYLFSRRPPGSSQAQPDQRPEITVQNARTILDALSLLLSFANGGYTGPLFIEAIRTQPDAVLTTELALAYRTTPLEQLGATWVTVDANLPRYLSCLMPLQRMLSSSPWRDVFHIALIWYFQAIQPLNAQTRGKPWPIVASAVGATLERLSVALVVDELGNRGLDNRQRLDCMLRTMGISPQRGFDDVDHIQPLIDLRNDATHPRPASQFTQGERDRLLSRGIQWIEEALLWRLGYEGSYADRTSPHGDSIQNRYMLNSRPANW